MLGGMRRPRQALPIASGRNMYSWVLGTKGLSPEVQTEEQI